MAKQQSFNPPWWLRNKHIQSVYASVMRSRSTIDLQWEEVALPDGDFLDIAWAGPAPVHAPTLLLLHGMEGSVYSHYIQEMLELFVPQDWRVAVMHFRSCGGRLNRTRYLYNAEYTGDLKAVVDRIAGRHVDSPLFAMGFSLGGNILMRYLAQYPDTPLNAALAVSMPFELAKSADYLVPFYQHVLLRSLKRKIEAKLGLGIEMPITLGALKKINSLRRFDAMVTAPTYDYASVDEYYEIASSRQLLKNIVCPSLILHAMDDPFVPLDSVPSQTELSPEVTLEVSQHGGHMGFIKGGLPWKPSYWFTQRIMSFFEAHMGGQSHAHWLHDTPRQSDSMRV